MSKKVVRSVELEFIHVLRTPFTDVRTRYEHITEVLFANPKESPALIGLFLTLNNVPPREEPPIATTPVGGDHGHWLAENKMTKHVIWLTPLINGMPFVGATQYIWEKLLQAQSVDTLAPVVFLRLIAAIPKMIPYRGTDLPLVPHHKLSMEEIHLAICDYPEMTRKVFFHVREHWRNTEELTQIFAEISHQFPDDKARLAFLLLAYDNILREFANMASSNVTIRTAQDEDDATSAIEDGKKPN